MTTANIKFAIPKKTVRSIEQEIAAYAKAHAGSDVDLDEALELAAILIKMAKSIENSAI